MAKLYMQQSYIVNRQGHKNNPQLQLYIVRILHGTYDIEFHTVTARFVASRLVSLLVQ